MKNKIFIIFLLGAFFLTAGPGCSPTTTASAVPPITLTIWRVFDDEDAFAAIIADYKKTHPNITIVYKKFRYEEYENALLNALAEDRGPDIFSLPSAWLFKYQPKLAPLPPQTTMLVPVIQGTVKKTTIAEKQIAKSLTIKDLKSNFVDAVANDAVLDQGGEPKIYGLPLYVDTLAMFYNPVLFNNAGISLPPQYWNNEFQQDVKKLTKENNQGNIIQSGAALGGNGNIDRSQDILSLLMMQSGAIMMSNGAVLFNTIPPGGDQGYNPGPEALRFYTDFSNPGKEVYCWNGNLPDSLNMFAQGNLAMMFSYSYNLPVIRALAPKLNFSVAKMPQLPGDSRPINYANYWLETVSVKSKNVDAAWNFIQFETSAAEVKSYLKIAKKPTALRSLIDSQKDDLDLGVFVDQALTAQSWYRGKNPLAAETAMGEMIDLAIKNGKGLQKIINDGATKVQLTIQ